MNSRRVVRRMGPALFAREVEGAADASKLRITVVCARWNPTITDALLSSALGALSERGARPGNVTVVRIPGAFELPAACRLALSSKSCDAVVALAAIVRGETTHHEVLANSVGAALASLSSETGRPVGFGLLTCETMDQARARTGKGAEAAEAAVEMANLRRQMRTT
ncbi:MAG: 6,7-dimethyl-8-ribityllumazine synthase [Acidobacteriota bacterium]